MSNLYGSLVSNSRNHEKLQIPSETVAQNTFTIALKTWLHALHYEGFNNQDEEVQQILFELIVKPRTCVLSPEEYYQISSYKSQEARIQKEIIEYELEYRHKVVNEIELQFVMERLASKVNGGVEIGKLNQLMTFGEECLLG